MCAIKDATAVALTFSPGATIPSGFSERFIHSEIYIKFPEVNAVVHANTESILPFANQPKVPLVTQISTASLPDHTQTLAAQESRKAPVIGAGAPIFEFSSLPANVLSARFWPANSALLHNSVRHGVFLP
ncbi:hypothetical protein B0H19DRAFT_1145609 [Mycena capillaripes]|nr:hypothetical protein B0H19DRAFT_1145609 [Mycena capillaripes]